MLTVQELTDIIEDSPSTPVVYVKFGDSMAIVQSARFDDDGDLILVAAV